jgi:hypothetical protein
LLVLLHSLLIDWLMIEPRNGWLDVVSLSHVEVLSEVLISAPPVGVDHADSLISSNLMEVGVSDVVLLSISWHSELVWSTNELVNFTCVPQVLRDHTFLLLLGQQIQGK